MARSLLTLRVLIQASIVNWLVSRRLLESGTITVPSVGSKMKDWPTLPLAKPAPPCCTPLLVPSTSEASPSAAHQLTRPDAGGAHTGTYTVSTAFELITDPMLLETRTE